MTLGGSLGQAARVDAPMSAGLVGLTLVGAGAATFAIGAATGTEEGAWVAVFGTPVVGVARSPPEPRRGGTNEAWTEQGHPAAGAADRPVPHDHSS